MIRIAIADDDPQCRAQLKALLDKYSTEHEQPLEVTAYPDGASLLRAYHAQFQIVLLDIEMPQTSGLETAKRIREQDKQVRLLFVTGFAQYAIDGYEVEASGFIVKPVSPSAFNRQMDKVLRTLEKQESRFLVLSNTREVRRVAVENIRYIESSGHYVVVHTGEEDITFLATLRSVEQQLAKEAFYLINPGTLVNLAFVEAVTQQDTVVGGKTLAVSRVRKKGLLDGLLNYLNHEGRGKGV